MDILIVKKNDGTYQSTPFYVHFKKAIIGEKVELFVKDKQIEGLSLHINCKKVVSCSDGDGANMDLFSRDELEKTSTIRCTHRCLKTGFSQRLKFYFDMMDLNEGENTFVFRTLKSNLMKPVCARVWRESCKIVVTDIDGTLTRSNFRGHLMPRLGFDWSHCQVAEFFQQLHNHGYKIVYLTARSIKLTAVTQEYLSSLNFPPGPIFPALKNIGSSLVSELFREDSKLSKVSHLEFITKIFPDSFVAGFGNNEKDLWTYSQVKIPPSHVFIINNNSRINCNARQTSYQNLLEDIGTWFPRTDLCSEKTDLCSKRSDLCSGSGTGRVSG